MEIITTDCSELISKHPPHIDNGQKQMERHMSGSVKNQPRLKPKACHIAPSNYPHHHPSSVFVNASFTSSKAEAGHASKEVVATNSITNQSGNQQQQSNFVIGTTDTNNSTSNHSTQFMTPDFLSSDMVEESFGGSENVYFPSNLPLSNNIVNNGNSTNNCDYVQSQNSATCYQARPKGVVCEQNYGCYGNNHAVKTNSNMDLSPLPHSYTPLSNVSFASSNDSGNISASTYNSNNSTNSSNSNNLFNSNKSLNSEAIERTRNAKFLTLKATELRVECKQRSLSTCGSKQILINRIHDYEDKMMSQDVVNANNRRINNKQISPVKQAQPPIIRTNQDIQISGNSPYLYSDNNGGNNFNEKSDSTYKIVSNCPQGIVYTPVNSMITPSSNENGSYIVVKNESGQKVMRPNNLQQSIVKIHDSSPGNDEIYYSEMSQQKVDSSKKSSFRHAPNNISEMVVQSNNIINPMNNNFTPPVHQVYIQEDNNNLNYESNRSSNYMINGGAAFIPNKQHHHHQQQQPSYANNNNSFTTFSSNNDVYQSSLNSKVQWNNKDEMSSSHCQSKTTNLSFGASMPYLKNVQINDDGLSKVKFADINNEGQMNIVVNELEHPQTREVKYASQHSAEQNSVYSYQIPKGMKPVVRESTQNMKDVTEKNEFLQQYGTKIIHSTENTIKTFEQLAKDLQQHTTMTESNFMCANTIKLHEEMLAAQYNRIKYLHRELLDNQILLKNHQSVIFAIDNTQDDNPDLAPIVSMLKGINIEDVKDKYSKLYLQHKEEDQKINNRMNDHKKLLQTEEHLQELAHIGKATEDIVRLITQDPKSSLLVVSLIRKYQDERNGKIEKRYFKSNDMANNNDGVTLENSINNATNQQSSINAVNQQHTYVTNGQKVINSIVNGINDKEGIIGAKQSASKSNNTVRVQHQQSKANSKINTKNYKNVQKTIAKTPARKRIVKTNLASAPQTSNSPLQNSGTTENSIHRRQENGSKHNEAGMLAGSSNKKVISGTVVDMEEIFKSVIDSAHYSNIQSNDTPESAKPDDLIRNYVSNVPSSIANNTPNLYTNRQQMSHVDNDIHTFGGNNTNDTQSPNEIEPSFYTNVVTSNTTMAHQQMNYIQKNQQIFEHETVEHLYQTNNAGHLMSDGNVQQQVIYSSQVLNNNHQQILVNNYSQNNHVDNSMTQMNSNNGCTSNIVRESNSYQGDSNSNHYEQAIFSSLNNNQSYQIDNTGMHYQVPIHESIAFNSNYFNNSTSHTNSTQMIVDNGDLQQNNNVHLSGDHSSNMDINSSNDYQHSTSNSLAQNNANAINQNKEFPAIYADSWYPQNNHLDNNGNNSATNMVNNGGYQEINGHNSNDNLNSLVSDNSCYDNHETDSNNMIFDAENNDCLNEMDWDHEMSP